MDVSGKKVIITGGAGGLGTTTVQRLAAAGAHVVVVDINEQAANALIESVSAAGSVGSAQFVACDLGDIDATTGILNDVVAGHEGIDVLINNAAIYPSKRIDEYTMDEYRAVQRVNVEAAVAATNVCVPGMRDNGWGRIINIASITFYGGWASLMPYVVSKGSLVGLTRALARELGEFNINVNAISPGAFPTDAEKIHPDPEGYTRFVLEHQSLKRRGDPADIANAIQFFASDASSFVTGQVLNVDGGWVMH